MCECNLKAKWFISGPKAANPNQPFYICSLNKCRYYRFERDIEKYMWLFINKIIWYILNVILDLSNYLLICFIININFINI